MTGLIDALNAVARPADPITLVGFLVTIWIGFTSLIFKLSCMAYDKRIAQREAKRKS
jgi:hypothetical protein